MITRPLSRRVFAATMALAAVPSMRARAQDSSPIASPETGECIKIEDSDACLPLAPESDRVDLATPTFSNPTQITHPLFPVTEQAQIIQLGEEAGTLSRTELTHLPGSRTIEWNGLQIDSVITQYVAYADQRIIEVAIDYHAQDDAGNVWYMGEDVSNFEDGVVADAEGTWLAGRDGPAGMIMPAAPRVGDVFRPENIPGLVFEEVTVLATDQVVDGPQGAIDGAIITGELLMDGSQEQKMYAPGYGEFRVEAEDEFAAVAIGVPLDAREERPPAELGTLTTGASKISDTVSAGDWDGATTALADLDPAWQAVQSTGLPLLIEEQVTNALEALGQGVEDQSAEVAQQAALDLHRALLDLQLLYQPLAEVDLARMDVWSRQLTSDGAAADVGAVSGDVAALETIWARVGHEVADAQAQSVETDLSDLRTAVDQGDVAGAVSLAARLQQHLAGTT